MKNKVKIAILALGMFVFSAGTMLNAQVIEGEGHEKCCVFEEVNPNEATVVCKGEGTHCTTLAQCFKSGNEQL